MKKLKKEKIELYEFSNLGNFPIVSHFISTRNGGFSDTPFDSLNLSLHAEDNENNVLKNRANLANTLEAKPGNFVFMKQVHGRKIAVVGEESRGKGAFSYEDAIDDTDALISDVPGFYLTVQIADCVPVLLFDHKKKIIAVVHAGWRGTMKHITSNTVDKMQAEFECDPQNIVAGIGPSIGSCCFESEDPSLQKNWERSYSKEDEVIRKRSGRTWIDLCQANKVQLVRLGVREENIEIAGICTSCNTNEFYSYKKEGKTGRFGVGIMINPVA